MTPEEKLYRIAKLQRRFINFDTDIKRLWKRIPLFPQGYPGIPASAAAPVVGGSNCEDSIYIRIKDIDSNVVGNFFWNATEGYYENTSYMPFIHLRYEFSGLPGVNQVGQYILKDPSTLCESSFSDTFVRPTDCADATLPDHTLATNDCGYSLDPFVYVEQFLI